MTSLYGDKRRIPDVRISGSGSLIPSLNADTVDGKNATAFPSWTKYTIGYAALSAAGLTNTVTLFTLPAKTLIHGVVIDPTQAFSGGLISGYTLSVGITGTLTKYCTAVSVFSASTQAPQAFMGLESMGSGTAIKVTATSITGLLNTATAGSADIYALTSLLP